MSRLNFLFGTNYYFTHIKKNGKCTYKLLEIEFFHVGSTASFGIMKRVLHEYGKFWH